MLLTKVSVSLVLAKRIAQKAQEKAAEMKLSVSIAVVNEAGQLLYFLRMDEASNISIETAIAKAQHAANYRRDTRVHEEALKAGQLRTLALPRTVSIEGGVQLLHEGKTVGAIGVSGASAVDDGKIAAAGAEVMEEVEE